MMPVIALPDFGIAAARPFQTASALKRCPGMAIPTKFNLAAL